VLRQRDFRLALTISHRHVKVDLVEVINAMSDDDPRLVEALFLVLGNKSWRRFWPWLLAFITGLASLVPWIIKLQV
jgi:hypothetical protein